MSGPPIGAAIIIGGASGIGGGRSGKRPGFGSNTSNWTPPTVSAPVSWEEVEACLAAGDPDLLRFTADAVLRRLEELGDLFAPVAELAQELPTLRV